MILSFTINRSRSDLCWGLRGSCFQKQFWLDSRIQRTATQDFEKPSEILGSPTVDRTTLSAREHAKEVLPQLLLRMASLNDGLKRINSIAQDIEEVPFKRYPPKR